MTKIRTLFGIVTLIICCILVIILLLFRKSDNKLKKVINRLIYYGISALIAYYMFVINADNMLWAYIFDAVYFALTDFLAMSMMMYVINYVTDKEISIKYFIPFYIFSITDGISLLLNFKFHHMFTLIPAYTKFSGITVFYWGISFTVPHYFHLLYCYLMVFTSFVLLLYYTIKSPAFYKSKYFHILLVYAIVILTNFFCYTMDYPIDFSVLLYAVLAVYILYFSIYSTPRSILFKTLHKFYGDITDALIFYDLEGKCIYANSSAKTIFSGETGFSGNRVEEYRRNWVLRHEDSPIHMSVITDSEQFFINNTERRFVVEYQELYLNSQAVPVGYFFKFQDKTDEINSFLRERYLATHDFLTGLYNREYFFECVDRKIKELARRNEATTYMMVCSNIKDFKLVNELFGQSVGDSILKKLAEHLRRLCSMHNIYGRINDDKFALFIKKDDFNPEVFKESIEDMRKLADNSVYSLHVIVGICEVFSDKETAQGIYDKAKMAIDAQRNDFQHIFAYYDSNLMERILMEKNVLKDFENAVEQRQFMPYLQPIVSAEGKLEGAEVLARWNHPVKGQLLPEYFINVLENASIIQKLDQYMWEEAVKILSDYKNNDFLLNINVSLRDMFYIDIERVLVALCNKYEVNPSRLCIEIPEQVLTDDFTKAIKLFDRLHAAGFKIAIDKFGSGYSSLNLLKDITVDVLKMDLAFLQENENQERNIIILESVIRMSKSLDMKVVSLGIENQEQLRVLKGLGGQIFQGNCFSPPLSYKDFSMKYL